MLRQMSQRFSLTIIITVLFFNFYFITFFQELKAIDSSIQSEQSQVENARGEFNPGDAVQITVYPDTTALLNNTFPIDSKGYVFLPILGNVQVSKMSVLELNKFLESNYSQYLRITIVKTRPLIKAGLFGGFTRPGFYYVDKNATLWDVINRGVAVTSNKGLKKMKWQRDGKTVESELIPLVQSGRSLQEIGFRSGDQIFTPVPVATRGVLFDTIIPLITFGLTIYSVYLSYYFYTRITRY